MGLKNRRSWVILGAFLALSTAGCYKDKGNKLPEGQRLSINPGQVEQLAQFICCTTAGMKPENADKCTQLGNGERSLMFNNIRTSGIFSDTVCATLDETPFWSTL